MTIKKDSLLRRMVYMAIMYFIGPLPLFFVLIMSYEKSAVTLIALTVTWVLANAAIIYIAYRFVYRYTEKPIIQKANLSDLLYVFGGYATILISNGILTFLNHVIYNRVQSPNNLAIEKSLLNHHQLMVAVLIIHLVVVTPIVEELIYRGMAFNLFFNSNQVWLKILLSAVLFSSAHQSNTIFSFLLYAFIGIILGFVYWKSGKLQNSIALHALTNLVAVLATLV
ncbi:MULTISPECIES: CPBP family intramembrane glutamic endopeptidase [Lacticaseibacillus]|uniref:Type II CAAX endopeptidase family protein n=2 Tax=Lacticaseibacillus TaxID=2759736 RepID=A0ABY8DWF4_9LACO|nr:MULTISPECIES: type II CAAX endopeptidase family protein [Lacticaseibacillus]MDG3062090.1 type II CAAX endopeptidase family protein [Lacticaseibacillus sp. BCRC 81376]WFB39995.1 type II CAAX endopeptidase family protein [Lacticaseibacillus huelsenbergensis]WFB41727.1 type II CAAX endopeptidase family protein [Lacticaseibacillus huelsenbergensis]